MTTPADGRAFDFLRLNRRPAKPRSRGLTEIRGPYYTPVGKRYLADVLETMGLYVDGFKFGGGSFVLYPRPALRELIDLCHAHGVSVSTGGSVESVLARGRRPSAGTWPSAGTSGSTWSRCRAGSSPSRPTTWPG